MAHIKKRHLNGMVFSSDKIEMVCFTPVPMDAPMPLKTKYDFNKKLLQIWYTPDTMTSDLSRLKEVKMTQLNLVSPLQGCYSLLDTLKCNNLEYIQDIVPVKSFCQYIVDDSKCSVSGTVVKDGVVTTIIRKSDVDNYYSESPDEDGLTDYCAFINSSGGMYVETTDGEKPDIVNMYGCTFGESSFTSSDQSVAGTTEEFAVNDVIVFAEFIRVLKEKYPDINFYTNPEEKDSDHYNQWICYKMTPRNPDGAIFYNHVMDDKHLGRYWPTTLEFSLEYSAVDLPTVMAKRDRQQSELFLNEIHTFQVPIGSEKEGDDRSITCALFWDRNGISGEYQKETSQDDSGYSLMTWPFTGKIIYVNIEHKITYPIQAEQAIFDLLEELAKGPKEFAHGESHLEPEPEPNETNKNEKIGLIL